MTYRRQFITSGIGFGIMAALPQTVKAHKEATTLSQIEWNAIDNTLEVTHGFHIHEAETYLAKIGILGRSDLTKLRERAKLALYTAKHFKLIDAGNNIPIDLELIGAEIDGRTAFVYQQAILQNPPHSLIIDCRLLRRLNPMQINNVDVKISGPIRSLKFKGQDGPKKVLA